MEKEKRVSDVQLIERIDELVGKLSERIDELDNKLAQLLAQKADRERNIIGQLTKYADFAQKAVGSIAGAVALCYVLGFVIVNTSLLRYGICDFSLFKARYVAAGALYSLLLAIAFGFTWRYKIGLSLIGLWIGIGSLFLVLWRVGMLKADLSVETLVWSLSSWTLFVDAATFGLYATFIQQTRPIKRTRFWPPRPSPLLVFGYLIAIVIYGQFIYPEISPAIGGGASTTVQFVADKDQIATLGYLMKLEEQGTQDKSVSEQVELLDQTDKVYFILVPVRDQTGEIVKDKDGKVKKRAVEIDKSLVKGVIHVER